MSHLLAQPLSSTRLLLRRLQVSDVAALTSYRALPEVARYQGWESFDRDAASRLVQGQENSAPGIPGTWFQFAIVEKATNCMVGDCGLHCMQEEPRQFEIGITLNPNHQQRGFASEAVNCVIDFVFGTLNGHRLFSITDAENSAARSLFQRLGFRQESLFVEHRWYKGRWASEVTFALLRREWDLRTHASATHKQSRQLTT